MYPSIAPGPWVAPLIKILCPVELVATLLAESGCKWATLAIGAHILVPTLCLGHRRYLVVIPAFTHIW